MMIVTISQIHTISHSHKENQDQVIDILSQTCMMIHMIDLLDRSRVRDLQTLTEVKVNQEQALSLAEEVNMHLKLHQPLQEEETLLHRKWITFKIF